ncbi:MAG: SBBP repeat-containing protein [Bacteroidetes bacterium]|nr:SBBP repeat-containing protein [Bacteroidota bacterium]
MKSHCYTLTVIICVGGNIFANNQPALQIGNRAKYILSEKEHTQFTVNMHGSGLCFTPNKGQIADVNGKQCPDVLYKGDGGGADIYLRKTGISYVYTNMGLVIHEIEEQIEDLIKAGTLTQTEGQKKKDELLQKEPIKMHRVDMDFANCNKNITTQYEDLVDGYSNYYYANCPQGITYVNQYNKVTYKNMYKGIDVAYYGNKETGIKYDIIVQPGADPNQIKLRWMGTESLHLNSEGHLVIKTSINEFTESIPKVYQNINGKIVDIKTSYSLSFGEARSEGSNSLFIKEGQEDFFVSFSFGEGWDEAFPLIIDPWATYYGGNTFEYSSDIANDNMGNVLIAGYTYSSNFPVSSGAFQFANAGGISDCFIVKFTPTGIRMWSTYYGGAGFDRGKSIASDLWGNVYLAGEASSTTGIASGGFQNVCQGGGFFGFDAFLVKFNGAGVRIWGTYYGGSTFSEYGNGVAVDVAGNSYLVGITGSSVGIAFGGFQNILNGSTDAFLVKFNGAGTRIWATYYGGSGFDRANNVTIDFSGNIYVIGITTSTTGMTAGNGFQNSYGGIQDGFLVKFNSAGNRIWDTYYGGTGTDSALSVTTDLLGNVYLAGTTNSLSNIALGGFQNIYGGGALDAFLVKFNGLGNRIWATYCGGSGDELSAVYSGGIDLIATDGSNNIYFYLEIEDAITTSQNIDACSYQPAFNGGLSQDPNGGYPEDQIIIKLAPTGKKICGTYIGGTGEDDLDGGGGIVIYGNSLYATGSTDGLYPVTPGAFQTFYAGPSGAVNGGVGDAFLIQLCTNICEGKVLDLSFTANTNNICPNVPIKFIPSVNNSCDTSDYKFHWTFAGGNPLNSDSANPTVTFNAVGTYDVKLVVTTACKKDSITIPNYITIKNCTTCNLVGQFSKGTGNCAGCGCKEWILVNATGGTSPYAYNWSSGYTNRYENRLCPGNYTINIKDKNGCSVNVNITTP